MRRTPWWKRRDFRFFSPRGQRDLDLEKVYVLGRRFRKRMDEVEYGNVESEIVLNDRESVTASFDPKQKLGVKEGQMGGLVYTFHLIKDGQFAVIRGGKRLLTEIQKVVKATDKPTVITITAYGEARTLERKYAVKKASR